MILVVGKKCIVRCDRSARCSVDGAKFWFNMNPSDPNHFFKTDFIDKRKEKKLLRLHFTMDDNLSFEKYKSELFFDWHGKLTESCLQGRESFVLNNNIDLQSEISIKEFIQLTENEYGREVIRQLKERLENE